jgi:hypothetical protein
MSTSTVITPAILMTAIPGGTTFWNKVRVQAIRVWAETSISGTGGSLTTPQLRVDVSNDGVNEPTVSWTDTGTTGQRRPGIAFSLGLREQASWFGVASTQNIFNVRVLNATATEPITVQAVVELLSPNLS